MGDSLLSKTPSGGAGATKDGDKFDEKVLLAGIAIRLARAKLGACRLVGSLIESANPPTTEMTIRNTRSMSSYQAGPHC